MRKLLELGKDILIVLLTLVILCLLLLALPSMTVTDTPWLAGLLRPVASVFGLSQAELTYTPMAAAQSVTDAAQPVAISVRNPAGRTSFQYDFSSLDAVFEQLGASFAQALETAGEPERVSFSALHAALGVTGVAFRYPGELAPQLVASWLNVQTELEQSAQWYLLAAEDGGVRLYLAADTVYACQTQLSAETLEQLLQSYTPDGSFFAAEDTTGRFSSVQDLCLIPAQTPQVYTASSANPCDARFCNALATSLGFNPYGDARYTDDAGNTSFTETGYLLRISASGRLSLKSDGQSSRFQAASAQQEDLVERARSLLSTMAGGLMGDARLYLTSVYESGGQTICTFDYYLHALPVTLSGGHAAEVRFSGTSVVQAELQLKTYTLDTHTLPVLPAAQAAAIVPYGDALQLVYRDSGTQLDAGWQS